MSDLVNIVAFNKKNVEENALLMCIDCRKEWELLIAYAMKVSEYAGDRHAIISKILAS